MAHLGPISREVIMQTWIDKTGHLSETFWNNSQFQSIKKQLAEGPSLEPWQQTLSWAAFSKSEAPDLQTSQQKPAP
jgi:hypothetical protein